MADPRPYRLAGSALDRFRAPGPSRWFSVFLLIQLLNVCVVKTDLSSGLYRENLKVNAQESLLELFSESILPWGPEFAEYEDRDGGDLDAVGSLSWDAFLGFAPGGRRVCLGSDSTALAFVPFPVGMRPTRCAVPETPPPEA